MMRHLLTIFIIGDGDGDDVAGANHGTAPVVTQRRPKMHLELFFGLKNRVVIDVNCTVFDLRNKMTKHVSGQTSDNKKIQTDTNRHKQTCITLTLWTEVHLFSFEESDA